jgi:predicted dehydrogenase
MGFAILGTGASATAFARAFRDCAEARLVVCLSRRMEAARRFGAEHGCRGETSLERLLDDPEVEAVIVATEPDRHDLAVPVVRAGRHVLIEKPLASSSAMAAEIVQACHDAKVTASVVAQRRFAADFLRLQTLLRDGAIGQPTFATFTHLAARDAAYFLAGNGWRRSAAGGVTMNLLIHGIDRLLCLFGAVRSVHATLAPTPGPGCPDRQASILLTFESGLHAVARGTTECPRTWGDSLEISGDRGTLLMRNETVRIVDHPLGVEGRRARLRGLVTDLLRGRRPGFASPRTGPLPRQLEDFIASIRTGSSPSVTLDDGLASLRVVEAAHRSHAAERAVVLSAGGAA